MGNYKDAINNHSLSGEMVGKLVVIQASKGDGEPMHEDSREALLN